MIPPVTVSDTTIIFLPGLLNDARLFGDVIAALPLGASYSAGAVDFSSEISGLAAGILAKAEVAGASSLVLVALSMGGYVAFEIIRQLKARGEEHRLQRLVLLNTSARADSEAQRERRQGLIKLSQMGKFKGVTPRLMPQLLGPEALKNEAITDLITDMAISIGQAGFVRQQEAILSRPDSRELLPRIGVPALVIGGSLDQLTPPEVVREIAAGIPNSQLHMIEGVGHLSPLEASEEVTPLLTRFLT